MLLPLVDYFYCFNNEFSNKIFYKCEIVKSITYSHIPYILYSSYIKGFWSSVSRSEYSTAISKINNKRTISVCYSKKLTDFIIKDILE
jgi:hypothetical protein